MSKLIRIFTENDTLLPNFVQIPALNLTQTGNAIFQNNTNHALFMSLFYTWHPFYDTMNVFHDNRCKNMLRFFNAYDHKNNSYSSLLLRILSVFSLMGMLHILKHHHFLKMVLSSNLLTAPKAPHPVHDTKTDNRIALCIERDKAINTFVQTDNLKKYPDLWAFINAEVESEREELAQQLTKHYSLSMTGQETCSVLEIVMKLQSMPHVHTLLKESPTLSDIEKIERNKLLEDPVLFNALAMCAEYPPAYLTFFIAQKMGIIDKERRFFRMRNPDKKFNIADKQLALLCWYITQYLRRFETADKDYRIPCLLSIPSVADLEKQSENIAPDSSHKRDHFMDYL